MPSRSCPLRSEKGWGVKVGTDGGTSCLKDHLIAMWRMNWKVSASEPQFASPQHGDGPDSADLPRVTAVWWLSEPMCTTCRHTVGLQRVDGSRLGGYCHSLGQRRWWHRPGCGCDIREVKSVVFVVDRTWRVGVWEWQSISGSDLCPWAWRSQVQGLAPSPPPHFPFNVWLLLSSWSGSCWRKHNGVR